MAVHHPETHP